MSPLATLPPNHERYDLKYYIRFFPNRKTLFTALHLLYRLCQSLLRRNSNDLGAGITSSWKDSLTYYQTQLHDSCREYSVAEMDRLRVTGQVMPRIAHNLSRIEQQVQGLLQQLEMIGYRCSVEEVRETLRRILRMIIDVVKKPTVLM